LPVRIPPTRFSDRANISHVFGKYEKTRESRESILAKNRRSNKKLDAIMSVTVLCCTVADLFSQSDLLDDEGNSIDGTLAIPEYQRPYCWQEKQLQNLILDLKEHHSKKTALPYYLGSLILHQQDGKLNIIDGQQRITTLAILNFLSKKFKNLPLRYESPLSQQQIRHNLVWLKACQDSWLDLIDFKKLQLTLVVTQSEDDAYRFFETQNTGGVRLLGPDIIKAHHLREIDRVQQGHYAKQWEALGNLNPVVLALLKGRYWSQLAFKEMPSHKEPKLVLECIVDELAEATGIGSDIAFSRMQRVNQTVQGSYQEYAQQGYDMRQPLNAGINCISYLKYFQQLRQRYWLELNLPHETDYVAFCKWLQQLKACSYLQDLFETCLLMYISQFGEYELEAAAKKLFRVVYSKRVSNQKAVREKSIPSFLSGTPVLDWIAQSYTPQQCFNYLDSFEFVVETSNLDEENSVKKRFVQAVNQQFELKLKDSEFKTQFAKLFSEQVKQMRGTR
jgi:uncharacterized protein with ParB-like and HNH nuclease domain